MRKSRRRLMLAISLVLCLAVSIGLAVAYFTDYEDARGGAILHLTGQTELDEHMDDNNKEITISNVGEADMVVRVRVIGDESHMTVTADSDWEQIGDWYYYKKVLKGSEDGKSGDKTSTIKAEVKVSEDELISDFDIIVVHESQRVTYDVDKVSIPDGWEIASISAE